ncbi:MAG TPA: ATP-binding protein [Methanospirillum sp.]|nr:ATP-binding protein [Methanospirillum sp.]
MVSLPDQISVLNLLFCVALALISVYGYRKIGNTTPLFIGGGFLAFALSHLMTLMHLNRDIQIPLVIIRSIGYILVGIGLFLISREVIRRYAAEIELRHSYEELEARVIDRTRELQKKSEEQIMLLDTMDAQVWYQTDINTYGAVNKAYADFLGVTKEEIAYHRIEEFIPADMLEFCRDTNQQVFETGTLLRSERWITDREGNPHLFSISKTPKLSNEGTVEYVVCVASDNTDRKREENRLILANRKLNMLSSVTRHDILNDIQLLYAYLGLSRKYMIEPPLNNYYDHEMKAVQSIKEQIEFTRFYQDIGVQTPAWQDIATVIHNAAEKIPSLTIQVEIAFSGYSLYADPLFEKAIYNLIENTIHHGEHATRISFRIEEAALEMTLICSDDGAGITAEDKTHIFEKGFGKNTGFGLFLIREILSITQISIHETGEPGTGAEFRIGIPSWAYKKTG